MTGIIVRHNNDEKTQLSVKDNDSLSVRSLQQCFTPEKKNKDYVEKQSQNGVNDKSKDLQSSAEESMQKENETKSEDTAASQLLNEDSKCCRQELKQETDEQQKSIDSLTRENDQNEETTQDTQENRKSTESTDHVFNGNSEDDSRCPTEESSTTKEDTDDTKSRKRYKTLRIGWLHKDNFNDRRYSKMKKTAGGGVKRLKLDESMTYSAADIRRLAIEEFNVSEDEFDVRLGLFGGRTIDDFGISKSNSGGGRSKGAKNNTSDIDERLALSDDIWSYCKHHGTTLYKLNLYLLTTNKLKDNVRFLYHYVRVSKYSNESLYTECDKLQLHCLLLEQQFGDGPDLEQFEPLDHGYRISRIEKDGDVLLQVHLDDDGKGKSYEFPSADNKPGPHEVVHEIQGVYGGSMGLGLVTSCEEDCRPVFTWYRDGVIFKSAEWLCWVSEVRDDRPHVWRCEVSCKSSGKVIKSRDTEI